MRTSFLNKILAVLAVAFIALSSAFAQQSQTVDQIASAYTGGRGWTKVEPGALSGNAYSMSFKNMKAFSFDSSVAGAAAPYEGPVNDQPTSRPGYNYHIPDGSTIYVMPLGGDWQKMGETIEQVDIGKALGHATVTGGNSTVSLNVRAGRVCEFVNFVVVTPTGGRFWGHHGDPSTDPSWVIPNVAGSPRTAWCYMNGAVVTADSYNPGIRAQFAKLK